MIQEQVRLPLSMAFGVVMQGIRIRLGRSLVTIGGVVLGIAFLMSTLAGQVVKNAVQEEEAMRIEVKRMAGFLAAEMGPPLNRTIGVIQTGPLEESEVRLLRNLVDGGLERIQWCRAKESTPIPVFSGIEPAMADLNTVARDANAVLLMGSSPESKPPFDDAALARIFDSAREKILAFTRPEPPTGELVGVSLVRLARDFSPEETAKIAEERRDARFRAFWLVVSSLVVTVGGITNAMLMSVTERFREIGTMKCLGALSSFIRRVFLLESALMGAAGGIAGACLGSLFSILAYSFSYGFGLVLVSMNFSHLTAYLLLSVTAGVVLSVVAAIYPASVAAAMVPAHALTTNV